MKNKTPTIQVTATERSYLCAAGPWPLVVNFQHVYWELDPQDVLSYLRASYVTTARTVERKLLAALAAEAAQ